jgi:vancomycin resistance protein YoaR
MSAEETGALSSSMSDPQEIDLVDEILGPQADKPASPAQPQTDQIAAVPSTATHDPYAKDGNSKYPNVVAIQPAPVVVDRAASEPAVTDEPVALEVASDPVAEPPAVAEPATVAESAIAAESATRVELTASEAVSEAASEPVAAVAADAAVAEAAAVEPAVAEAAAAGAAAVEPEVADATAIDIPDAVAHPRLHAPHPLAGIGSARRAAAGAWGRKRSYRPIRFAIGFVIAGAACLLLLVAVAAGIRSTYSDRVVPGVHVGSIDLSGLTHDQVVARLESAYAYMGQGEVTVTTATGTATISYQQTGRNPDVEEMAYAAIRIGHTGDPLADTIAMLRSVINGESVPVAVALDPTAVANEVRQLVSTNQPPVNAAATVAGGSFQLEPATEGKGIDEVAISQAIVDHLAVPDQASQFTAGGAFIDVKPTVTDADAQAAIDDAQKMLIDIHLTYIRPPDPTPTPADTAAGGSSAAATATPKPTVAASPAAPSEPKNYTISADTVLSWISFGFNSEGQYDASVDLAKIQQTIGSMGIDVSYAPIEPTVTFDSSGKPTGVTGGEPGAGLDITATAQAVADYLHSLESGSSQQLVDIVTAPVQPQLTPDSLAGFEIIGAWTTSFYPDISNGYGANIATPAKVLNGQVVEPGAQFSFLQRVGPIDEAHGFTLGGVIVHGKSDHTGAMGGGICSASTTAFNAAIWAGLKVDERHNHAYYIDRYPVGLDATVFSNGYQTYDMKWTNDTSNPIVIRSWATTRGSKRTVTVQLWSLPTGRTVTFTPAYKANVVKSTDSTVYTTAIPVGTSNRAEYPTDGFDTSRTRTVTDADGKVIHEDTWKSRYVKVDGILEIGVTSTPAPKPTGGPTPTPPPATPPPATPPPATPTPAVAPRRRRPEDDEAQPAEG